MKKKLIKFIQYFDFFGAKFSLKYKNYEYFKSFLGGIIYIFFLFFTFIFVVVSLISFSEKERMIINYYDSQLSETDIISFKNYSYGIGFKGDCEGEENSTDIFNDFFSYEFHYVSIHKNNNEREVNKYKINTHICEYSDFNYYSPDKIDLINVTNDYFCPDYLNESIQGIYTDNIFNYYEISLIAKYTDPDYYDNYYKLLTNNDCKLHIFSPIIAMDMDNVSSPFEYYLFDSFLQINPINYNKRNIFYKINKFKSFTNQLLDNFHLTNYLDYSFFDDYFLLKSVNRFSEKYNDYEKFARIYLRADTKRTNISREYERASNVIARIFSICSLIYFVLKNIISYLDKFYALNSVIRKIFKFNNVEGTDSHNLVRNIYKKLKISKIFKNQKFNIKTFYKYDHNKLNQDKLSFIGSNSDTNINKSILYIKPKSNKEININPNDKNEKNESVTLFMKGENKVSITHINNKSTQSFELQNSKNSLNFKFNPINLRPQSELNKKAEICLIYNFYEIFIYLFCFNLAKKKLEKKNKYMKKAVDKLLYNLDIHIYFNKMQMIELLNTVIFESYENSILKFLCKPYISISSHKTNIIDYLPKMYNPEINNQYLNEFVMNYNKFSEMKSKSKKDEKILKLLNQEIINLFGY